MKSRLSRRHALRLTGLGVIGAIAFAGCQSAPASPTAAPSVSSSTKPTTGASTAGSGSASSQPAGGPTAAPAATAPTQGGVTGKVTIMFWDGPPLIDLRRKAMDGYKAKFPNVEYQFTSVPGGYDSGYADKLTTMIAGGNAPDVFIIPDSDLPHYLTKNLARDLTPFVTADKYDLNQFPKAAIDNFRYKGGMYGLPDNITTFGVFYDIDAVQAAGGNSPSSSLDDKSWNFDAALNAAQKLTKTQGGRTTSFGYSYLTALNGWIPWVWANGGEFTNSDVTELLLNQDPAIEALQFLVDLRFKYKVAPSPADVAGSTSADLFKTGRIGLLEDGAWSIANYRSIKTFKWDAGLRPAGKAGYADYLFAYPLIVFQGTKSPDAAWQALKYFEDDAMPEIVKAGGLQGAKPSDMQKYFLQKDLPPAHAQLFIDLVEKVARPLPLMLDYREIEHDITTEINLLFTGQKTDVRQTIADVKAKIDPMLKANQFVR